MSREYLYALKDANGKIDAFQSAEDFDYHQAR